MPEKGDRWCRGATEAVVVRGEFNLQARWGVDLRPRARACQ